MTLSKIFMTATLVALSAASQAAPKPDALTAATSGYSAQPSFTGVVLQGPNVMNGASITVGQPLQLEVVVANPWTNNTVSMSLANPLEGMSLTQASNNQAQPTWILSWTPTATEIGTQSVSFVTLFRQISGANSGTVLTYQPGLPIKVAAGSGYVSDATAIKSLTINKASWNQKNNTLLVTGQVKLKSGYPLPPSTSVTLSYQSGSVIPDPGATIQVSSATGVWSTTITTLTAGQNPCVVAAVTSVAGTDTSAVAIKKVTGKATGCQP